MNSKAHLLTGLLSALVLVFSVGALASAGSEEFNRLETRSSTDLLSKTNILLRQYGNPEDFKITKEVSQVDECLSESHFRAKTVCEKKAQTQKLTLFAEGKGLLCKITDDAEKIKCIEKN